MDTSLPYASVVEEYTGASTTPSARYDYGDDLVRMDRGGVYYYIYDGLGSTRQLVNTAGAVTDAWGYSAFGELASHTGSTVNSFLFNAQQFDQASGNSYLRARYYDQSNGRFVSQDPLQGVERTPVTLHRYLYANNEPTDRIDPGGQENDLIETEGELVVETITAPEEAATSIIAQINAPAEIAEVAGEAGGEGINLGEAVTYFLGVATAFLTPQLFHHPEQIDQQKYNRMRVQLQEGTDNNYSRVILGPKNPGVPQRGVRDAMTLIYQQAPSSPKAKWFPFKKEEEDFYYAILDMSASLTRYTGSGTPRDGNIEREKWIGKDGKEYRLDLENLEGRNNLSVKNGGFIIIPLND